MSQSHTIKGGTTDEAFEEQCFLWETGASVLLTFFNLQDLLHMKHITHRSKEEKNKKKSIKGLFKIKRLLPAASLCVEKREGSNEETLQHLQS